MQSISIQATVSKTSRVVAKGAALAAILLIGCAGAGRIEAQEAFAPSLLDLREQDSGRFEVTWKTPWMGIPGAELRPIFPPSCTVVDTLAVSRDETMITVRWVLECGKEGLVGQSLGIAGLAASKTDALMRLHLSDGRLVRGVLSGRQPALTVPEKKPVRQVVADYLVLGIKHILLGVDHLLFVLGLLLLVRGRRRLLIPTITAFAVGHSVTLELGALGVVTFPFAPVEAAIALSILVLAVELARPESDHPGLIRRFPWAMALACGLVHGLGFAAALIEGGLPQTEFTLALCAFNAGIEGGLLLFVAGVWLTMKAFRPAVLRLPACRAQVTIYVIGSLAAFWMFQRMAAIF